MLDVGSRVIALMEADVEGKVIKSFGEGVYAGDFLLPPEYNYGQINPRIDLDNGKTVWGCESWWGPADVIRKMYVGWKWEVVDIDEHRRGQEKENP